MSTIKTISLSLPEELLTLLAEKAKELHVPRANVIRAAMRIGVDKVGVLDGQTLPESINPRRKDDQCDHFRLWLMASQQWNPSSATSVASVIRRYLREGGDKEDFVSAPENKNTASHRKAAVKKWEEYLDKKNGAIYSLDW